MHVRWHERNNTVVETAGNAQRRCSFLQQLHSFLTPIHNAVAFESSKTNSSDQISRQRRTVLLCRVWQTESVRHERHLVTKVPAESELGQLVLDSLLHC